MLPELKALKPGAEVAIAAQGYERLQDGRWETRRFEVTQDGSEDLTEAVPGGNSASMFSPEALQDFLRDSMERYPQAKNVVLFINAHGHPGPLLGGEKIVEGRWEAWEHEQISLKEVGDALEAVGGRIALLDLNCCEMGKVENYLELGSQADYFLASPQNEFVPKGHEDTAAFQDIVGACEALIADPGLTPVELGRHLIAQTTEKTTFVERGRTENPIPTLDLFDMKGLPGLRQGLDQLGRQLSEELKYNRERVLEAVGESVRYRDRVVDLHSFLEQLGRPALLDKVKEMTVESYRGEFRGRDYSETRPMAAFLPELPPSEKLTVPIASAAGDLQPLLAKIEGPRDTSNPRRWAMKLAGDLSDLRNRLEFDYPAMLEVLPSPSLSRALAAAPQREALVGLEHEVMELMTVMRPGDPKIAELSGRLSQLLEPLNQATKEVDMAPWLKEFRAIDGEQKLVERAQQRTLAQVREDLQEPLTQLQRLDELPSGWKTFLVDLTEAIIEHRWAPKVASEIVR